MQGDTRGFAQFDWTDVAVAMTKRLWAEGRTASQISSLLHDGTQGPSRSAVIGKVHRLRLEGRGRKASKPIPTREQKAAAQQTRRKTRITPPKPKIAVMTQPKLMLPWEGSRNIPLLDLNPHECRYSFNDNPPYLFCGQPTKSIDSSWCEHCYGIVYAREPIVRAKRVASNIFSSGHR